MSRHLCILAVLALAAFAAPAHDEHELIEVDNIVPESDLMDASAIQEQFLTIKSMISQGKTKGVADVIQTLIKLVDTEITPSIKQAHDVDQKILRTMMENVQTANNGFSTSVAITQGNANALRKSIQEEHKRSLTWKASASVFTTADKNFAKVWKLQSAKCCDQKKAGVTDVEYVPEYASCTYPDTKSGCFAKAQNAVMSKVTAPFTDGIAKYRKIRGECNVLTTSLTAARAEDAKTYATCNVNKAAHDALAPLIVTEQARIERVWADLVKTYGAMHTKLILAYDARELKVQKNSDDRYKEYTSTQLIRCMLSSYAKVGVLNHGTEVSCEAEKVPHKGSMVSITYPKKVPRLTPKLGSFEKMYDDSAFRNTCNKHFEEPTFVCKVRKANPVSECTVGKGFGPHPDQVNK